MCITLCRVHTALLKKIKNQKGVYKMDFWIYLVLGIAYCFLLGMLSVRLSRTSWLRIPLFLWIVTLCLAYDNLAIAFGEAIGEGDTLEFLSVLRYWTHALFTPTLALVGWDIIRRSGVRWAGTTAATVTAWTFTIALIIYQIVTSTLKETAELIPEREFGVLRYVPTAEPGGLIMVILVSAVLLLAGIILLVKKRWFWLALGTVLLFVGRAIPLPFESSAITNIYELILISTIYATVCYQDRQRA